MRFLIAVCLVFTSSAISRGDIAITELHPTGSSNTSYGADWFELTNLGSSDVDITGWSWDDFRLSDNRALLTGVTSIAPGESVVFIDGDAATGDAFIAEWFGGTAPAGFQIGFHSGPGLSGSGSDGVNLFDSSNNLVASLDYPAGTPVAFVTFDNAAGIINGTVSTLSVVGVNGAFTSVSGEIGSPGAIAIPEPSTLSFLGLAGLGLLLRRRNIS